MEEIMCFKRLTERQIGDFVNKIFDIQLTVIIMNSYERKWM